MAFFTVPGDVGSQLVRAHRSLDFWPVRQTESVTGHTSHRICDPSQTDTTASLYCPCCAPRGSLLGAGVHAHGCCELGSPPPPCRPGSPVLSGPVSARPLSGSLPAPASVSHLCQHLPSSTGCPQPLSRIFTWHMAPHCVLGVLTVTAGTCFASAQQPGRKRRGPLRWEFSGRNSSVALGWLFQETEKMWS